MDAYEFLDPQEYYMDLPLTTEVFTKKANKIDKYTGDVNKAAALLKLGIKSGLSELQELYTKYKVYSLLVYEHGYELLQTVEMLPPPDEALKIVVQGDLSRIKLFPMTAVLNYITNVEYSTVSELMKYLPEAWHIDIAVTHLLSSEDLANWKEFFSLSQEPMNIEIPQQYPIQLPEIMKLLMYHSRAEDLPYLTAINSKLVFSPNYLLQESNEPVTLSNIYVKSYPNSLSENILYCLENELLPYRAPPINSKGETLFVECEFLIQQLSEEHRQKFVKKVQQYNIETQIELYEALEEDELQELALLKSLLMENSTLDWFNFETVDELNTYIQTVLTSSVWQEVDWVPIFQGFKEQIIQVLPAVWKLPLFVSQEFTRADLIEIYDILVNYISDTKNNVLTRAKFSNLLEKEFANFLDMTAKQVIGATHSAISTKVYEKCAAGQHEEAMRLVVEYLDVETDSPYELLAGFLDERSAVPAAREALESLEANKTWLNKLF